MTPATVAYRRAYARRRYREYQAIILAAKGDCVCADCGLQWPPYVLDFDHRDPADKRFGISGSRSTSFTKAELAAEIAKCDVVCANCHRIRTWG